MSNDRYIDLAALIARAGEVVRSAGAQWVCELPTAAREADITRLETSINITLPPSYRDFLTTHNGARFSINIVKPIEWSHNVSIFSIHEVAEVTSEIRSVLTDLVDLSADQATSIVAIAEYGDGSDRCLLNGMLKDKDQDFAVIDAFHEVPREWMTSVIADSFDAWLRKMFEAVITDKLLMPYWLPSSIERT